VATDRRKLLPGDFLHFDNLSLRLNDIEHVKFSLAATWTNLARPLPILGCPQIRIPERPRSTLSRSCPIDAAFARLPIEKDAIAVGKFFETFAHADGADIFLFECFDIRSAEFRS
jgi:hypothetical protein